MTSSEKPYLSIVVPAYNEERRLPATLARILCYLDEQPYKGEIIVVDDGSEDDTVEAAKRLMSRHPNLRLIENDHRGKGYAVRTGMLAAQGQVALFTDADLAVPIEETARLLAQLEEGYDIAIGSREGLGARRYGEPWYRHLMGRGFNLLVRAIAIGQFKDTQCGFKCFRGEAAHDLFSRLQLYGDQAHPIERAATTAFDVEVLFLALKRGYRVAEVPVEWHYGLRSKVHPISDSIHMFRDVLAVRLNDWRGLYEE
ncbi:MAG: dolichyl-phosphate beta-glucosyltransferase [Chloroflexota bacterium]|nr:dolichyl-phosphate beta-glucosyltransferase [Chloroflexota bacterium]